MLGIYNVDGSIAEKLKLLYQVWYNVDGSIAEKLKLPSIDPKLSLPQLSVCHIASNVR